MYLNVAIIMYVKGWSLWWVSHLFLVFLNIKFWSLGKKVWFIPLGIAFRSYSSHLSGGVGVFPGVGTRHESDSLCRGVPASLMLSPERRRCSSQDVSRRWMNIAGRFAVASIRMQKLFIFPFLFFFRWKFVVSVKWLTLCLQECYS